MTAKTDFSRGLLDDNAALRQSWRARREMPQHAEFISPVRRCVKTEVEDLPKRVRELPAHQSAGGNGHSGVRIHNRDVGDGRVIAIEVVHLEFKAGGMMARSQIGGYRAFGKTARGGIAKRIRFPGVQAVEPADVMREIRCGPVARAAVDRYVSNGQRGR